MPNYRLFRRKGIYYTEDPVTGKQKSLHTRDRKEAERLSFHRAEACHNRHITIQIAKGYLAAIDPELAKRTWQTVMDKLQTYGGPSTQERSVWANRCKMFDPIRNKPIVETTAADLLQVLEKGGTSINHYLRRYHNLALGLGWLAWPILPKRLWPPIRHTRKRGITLAEHQRILEGETNQEKRLFYEILWETGAAQGDAARLSHENIDWTNETLVIRRQKIEHLDPIPSQIRIGPRLAAILKRLPSQGCLFPNLRNIRSGHRATDFHDRCERVGVHGVSLHSYRYAWAVRAREAGMPERFAQAVLGQASKAVHRAYAWGAQMKVPALEIYESQNGGQKIVPFKTGADREESPKLQMG
ncbi:MAG: tyrosine-type recombinase/integrase [Verrucomicrobiae bacterium]|nr:tyrosine-type recombinase/integrase [Verrucomicrobiae bacterium]